VLGTRLKTALPSAGKNVGETGIRRGKTGRLIKKGSASIQIARNERGGKTRESKDWTAEPDGGKTSFNLHARGRTNRTGKVGSTANTLNINRKQISRKKKTKRRKDIFFLVEGAWSSRGGLVRGHVIKTWA